MPCLFGREFTREEIEGRVGEMSQVGGARLCEIMDGPARGMRAVEFRTGGGLNFTVLPDRGMDISHADYCGRSLCWRSPTGETSPAFYQPEGLEWLYGFYGGLLVTCGLTYFGAPCEDEGEPLGLHGRASNIPARDVSAHAEWTSDGEYVISATGKVIEASVFGPKLCLTRRIYAFLGESRLFIHDEVQNIGEAATPHMMLYHINTGWPALDAGSELLIPARTVTPRDPEAEKQKERFRKFDPPTPGCREKVYYHDLAASRGRTGVAIVNRKCDRGAGFGVYVRFNRRQLPTLIEWKMMGQDEYTVGLEPATNRAGGRAEERAKGRLRFLAPGEVQEYDLEIGTLVGRKEIADFAGEVKALTRGRKPGFARNT